MPVADVGESLAKSAAKRRVLESLTGKNDSKYQAAFLCKLVSFHEIGRAQLRVFCQIALCARRTATQTCASSRRFNLLLLWPHMMHNARHLPLKLHNSIESLFGRQQKQ